MLRFFVKYTHSILVSLAPCDLVALSLGLGYIDLEKNYIENMLWNSLLFALFQADLLDETLSLRND